MFNFLDFVDDLVPRAGALNMAIDEILLQNCRAPVLRAYRWDAPSTSFGYFEKYETVRAAYAHSVAVRRWTGGGIVAHGEDFTFSLMVPRTDAFAKIRPQDSYRSIHQCLVRALGDYGVNASLHVASSENRSGACFQNPVPDDLMHSGEKIAGGAQRRTSKGLLHQGSIQSLDLDRDFGACLAQKFAIEVSSRAITPDEASAAEQLAVRKYATPEWLRKF
ncbi:MAG: hypothetical protein M3O82_04655 [Verrucomicrobiota bacterium]|nr:hypothetical protein [Verrucomicrobiota bacterium]